MAEAEAASSVPLLDNLFKDSCFLLRNADLRLKTEGGGENGICRCGKVAGQEAVGVSQLWIRQAGVSDKA